MHHADVVELIGKSSQGRSSGAASRNMPVPLSTLPFWSQKQDSTTLMCFDLDNRVEWGAPGRKIEPCLWEGKVWSLMYILCASFLQPCLTEYSVLAPDPPIYRTRIEC